MVAAGGRGLGRAAPQPPECAAEVMASDDSSLSVGVNELWQRFTRYFVMEL